MELHEMSTDFYCAIFDHYYDSGYDVVETIMVAIMGGEL